MSLVPVNLSRFGSGSYGVHEYCGLRVLPQFHEVNSIARMLDDVALMRESLLFQNPANIETNCIISTDFVAYANYENV